MHQFRCHEVPQIETDREQLHGEKHCQQHEAVTEHSQHHCSARVGQMQREFQPFLCDFGKKLGQSQPCAYERGQVFERVDQHVAPVEDGQPDRGRAVEGVHAADAQQGIGRESGQYCGRQRIEPPDLDSLLVENRFVHVVVSTCR